MTFYSHSFFKQNVKSNDLERVDKNVWLKSFDFCYVPFNFRVNVFPSVVAKRNHRSSSSKNRLENLFKATLWLSKYRGGREDEVGGTVSEERPGD